MTHQKAKRGFVALMSVIIISSILLIYVYLLSASSILQRFDALDGEDKRVSLGLAEACVNAATLQVAEGNTAPGKITVDSSDPQKTCEVCQVTSGGSILSRAVYNSAYTNLAVTIDPTQATYPVTAWSELVSNPIPACTVP